MANNITLTGKTYNENGILCPGKQVRYFGILYNNTRTYVSNTRITEDDSSYNFNLGDPDFMGQDGVILNGYTVLIVAWEPQSESLSSTALNRFCIYKFNIDGSDVYIADLQLIPAQKPQCNFTLQAISTVGTLVTATANPSAQYQWIWHSKTYYQRPNWFGENLFNVGISSIEYNFEGTWSSNNTHTFNNIGDYIVYVRVSNNFNLESSCQKSIRIKYNTPTGCLTFLPATPILNNELDVTACITDPNNRITSIDHIFDSNIVQTNTIKDFNYKKILDIFKAYILKQEIHWNDGFDDQLVVISKTITMENQPPVTSYTYANSDDYYSFTSTPTDIDGYIAGVKWNIYYKTPFDNSFKLVKSTAYSNNNNLAIDFLQSGTYKVETVAIDNLGATGSYAEEIIIEYVQTDCPDCPECPDCPDIVCPECPEVEYVYIYVGSYPIIVTENKVETILNVKQEKILVDINKSDIIVDTKQMSLNLSDINRTPANLERINSERIKNECVVDVIEVPYTPPLPPIDDVPITGYELVWSDEFNSDGLDYTKWGYHYLGPRKLGYNTADSIEVSNGTLKDIIHLNENGDVCFGVISTENSFQTKFGYFEMKAKLPKIKGPQSAFWLQSSKYGTIIGDPESSGMEIDIFEYVKNAGDRVHFTVHWDGYADDYKKEYGYADIPGIQEGWHTFGLLWESDSYKFYVDGILYNTKTNPTPISQTEQYILISADVSAWGGGVVGEVLPDIFEVEYVRVYKKII